MTLQHISLSVVITVNFHLSFTLLVLSWSLISCHLCSSSSSSLCPIANFPETMDVRANPMFAAAEIIITTPSQSPNPLIYVSNRNIGQNVDKLGGNTIAIFEFINRTGSNTQCQFLSRKRAHSRGFNSKPQTSGQSGSCLNLITQVFTGLRQIRSMNIGPVERWSRDVPQD